MGVKYVFFDLDGTLTDSSEGIFKSLIYAFDEMGMPRPSMETLKKFVGPPLTSSFKGIMGFDSETTQIAIEKYRERYTVKGLYENAPYPGITELLEKVKSSGKRLAVATSKPEFMSVEIIRHFGLDKYFDTVSGSANEAEDKAAVIRRAFERLSISPEDRDSVLMVGDRKHDIIGAHLCNIKCCGVGFGFAPEGELKEFAADYIAPTVKDLEALLLSL